MEGEWWRVRDLGFKVWSAGVTAWGSKRRESGGRGTHTETLIIYKLGSTKITALKDLD